MRITTNSVFTSYQRNITDTQERIDRSNQQITTGKKIIRLSDDPVLSGEIQDMNAVLDRNTSFKSNLEESITELTNTESALQTFADSSERIRQISLDALQPANSDKLPVLARQVRDMLSELIQQANGEFKGKFIFGGTKTTPDALTPVAPETSKLPFELIQETPTALNPSGLCVSFKGNNEQRSINRSPSATEVINTTATEAFGAGGTEFFQNIITTYNQLAFKSDGTQRTNADTFTTTETEQFRGIIRQQEQANTRLTETAGMNGSKIIRLELITEQMAEENVRLKALRSEREDTDIAQATLALKRDEIALQYTLQVGAKLAQQSLLDFIR